MTGQPIHLRLTIPEGARPDVREIFVNWLRGQIQDFSRGHWKDDEIVFAEQTLPLVVVEVSGGLVDESVYPDESAVNLIRVNWDAFDSDNGPEDEDEYLRTLEDQRGLIEQIPDEGHRKAILDGMARERINIDEELHERALQVYEAGKAQGIDP